ncbi:MAG TPA: hypothetical protein VMT62_07455 [Syntrophorhabdaceae bacterium]|nr:hypothetical protein [Syntrophorhabdaceae bacterium]
MDENKRVGIQDIHVAAWLQARNIFPELKLVAGRVIFSFPATDEFYLLLEEYNANPLTPIADFVGVLKRLRGQMMAIKTSGMRA